VTPGHVSGTVLQNSNNRLYEAWLTCLRLLAYGGALVVFILGTALAVTVVSAIIYLIYHYCLIVGSDNAKLENAVNLGLSFVFGGASAGAGGGLFMLRRRPKEEGAQEPEK
jgi:hypothetical protein